MTSPTVSVVIPAHNAADTLPGLLRALQRQTTAPLEVVVVDDGSDDDTASVAEAHGATVLRLARNVGPGPARNAGVEKTRGAVIAFTDADCVPPPTWIARSLAFMAERDARVTTSGYLGPVDDDLSSWFQHWEKRAREPFTAEEICATNGHCLTIERALFVESGGMPDLRTSEDFVFGRKIARASGVPFDPDNGVFHRFRPGLAAYFRQKMSFAQNSVRGSHAVPLAPTRRATFSPLRVLVELALTAAGLSLLGCAVTGGGAVCAAAGGALLTARVLPFVAFLGRRRGRGGDVPRGLRAYSVPWLLVRDVASMVGVARGCALVLVGARVRLDPLHPIGG